MDTILFYQINRQPSQMGKQISEQIYVQDFENIIETKKYTEFKAKEIQRSGYHVTITYKTIEGVWHHLKSLKGGNPPNIYSVK